MSVSKTYRVNCRNAKYALVTEDTSSAYAIGDTKPLEGLMTADIAFSLAEGTLYGDGAIKDKIGQVTGATLTIELNKLDIDVRAEIMGHDYTDGVLNVRAGDVAPKIAVYFELESSAGTKEQIWLLAGKAQPSNITGNQRTDSINFTTDSANINFVAIAKDASVLRMVDTADATTTTEKSTAFAAAPYSNK